MARTDMVVLIPAFEPDARLVDLVADLHAAAPALPVVVVDDGSGPGYRHLFRAVSAFGARVLTHPTNAGKGAALKTGLAHICATRPGNGVVCADSDGQHLPVDILRVAEAVARRPAGEPGPIVLGARRFDGDVPLRSRFGNEVTCWLVRLGAGLRLHDTQTGLRGYPAELVDWLVHVPGQRFDYEMAVLLRAHAQRRRIVEIPTATVYLDGNARTHFRPIVDSLRVYAPLLRFAGSSMLAGIIDVVALLVLMTLTDQLLVSVLTARALSATVNFTVNRRLVFGATAPIRRSALRYAALAIGLVGANYALMWSLTTIGAGLLAKVVTETVLYLTSFAIQNRVVFRDRAGTDTRPLSPPAQPALVSAAAATHRVPLRSPSPHQTSTD